MSIRFVSSNLPRYRSGPYLAGVAALTGMLIVDPVSATDRFWQNPSGGSFNDGSNWQGGQAPGASDTAIFNLGSASAYPVTLAANTTVQQLTVDNDQVGLNLSNFSLTVNSTGGLNYPSLTVGQAASSVGVLSVTGGTLYTGTPSTSVQIGVYGTGTLNLSNGASMISSDGVILAFRAGASGAANVWGAGTTWTSGQHDLGYHGPAALNITDGASVTDTSAANIGSGTNSTGTAVVSGVGSYWGGTAAYFTVGYEGSGSLTVSDGATMSVAALNLGQEAGSSGKMTVTGASASGRSTVTIGSVNPIGTHVGRSGPATLDISNGALVNDSGDFVIAEKATGAVTVGGAMAGYKAELNINGNLLVGQYLLSNPEYGGGTGSIAVAGGGSVTVSGRTYLGSTGSSAGTGTITLNGGTLTTHGLTALNNSPVVINSGTLINDGGSFNSTGDSLSLVGATSADTATLRFINSGATMTKAGSLYVGGSASAAGPGAGLLDLQPGANVSFAGPTTLWTNGTLNIAGGTFATSAINAMGGTLNFSAGGLRLTGSDLSVGSSGLLGATLDLTASAGDRNLVSVSGTTTVDPGASITINGGLFSTGKLVNNGSFAFNTGSLALTNDTLTIGSSGLLGSDVDLSSGRSLSVSGPVTIDSGASLTIDGGAFSARSLINNGSFNFISGTLGGSSDLIIDSGQLLGNDVSLTAGRNLSSDAGLIVGQTSSGKLSISGGGLASSAKGYVAQQPGSSGTVLIDGPGSTWTVGSTLNIGGSDSAVGGTAVLSLTNGGSVAAGGAVQIYSTGTVTVDSGSLSGASIANAGSLQLAHTASVSGPLTNTGSLTKTGDGVVTLNGALTNQSTVDVQAGTLALSNGASGNGSFTVASGATLQFSAGATGYPNSDLGSGSSVIGQGTVSFVSGNHNFGGTFNVSNVYVGNAGLTLPDGAAIDHLTLASNAGLDIVGVFANGTATVNSVDYSGGFLSGPGTINITGPLNITGTAQKTIRGGTVNLSGKTAWTDGGTVLADYAANVNNLSTGTFQVQSYASAPLVSFGTGNSTFSNAGTFIASGDGGTEFDSVFSNSGTLQLQGGLLNLAGGGTHSGTITAAAGTNLFVGATFGGSNTTFTSAATLTSAGAVKFDGNHVDFAGHLNVTGTTTSACQQLTFTSDADIQSLGTSFNVGGTAFFNTGITQTLPATALTSEYATLGGSDDLITNHSLAWSGGTISGSGRMTLSAGGTMDTSSQKTLDGRILDNAGTLTWSDGTFYQQSAFNNLAGATFDIRGSDPIQVGQLFTGPRPTIVNAGTITKSAGNGTNIYSAFTNNGAVDVQTGMLVFGGGTTSTGSYAVASNANLIFTLQAHSFASTASISGAGNVSITDSVATFDGSYNVTGSTTIGSPISSGSTTNVTFNPGSTISSFGATTTVNQYATLTLNTGQPVGFNDLTVWGTVGGADSITINGTLNGRGTIQNTILNNGEVSPGASPGTLAVSGNYKQDPDAHLHIEIASPNYQPKYVQQYDQLNVSGNAALGGVLDLARLDGFEPQVGDTYTVMNWGSRTGSFASVTGQDIGDGKRFAVTYLSNGLQVQAVALPANLYELADANNDAKVNAADLGVLAGNYNQVIAGGVSVGDFNLDGVVDINDLYVIRDYFGEPPGSNAGSFADALAMYPNLPDIPEPSSISLLSVFAPLLLRRIRRRVSA